MTNLIPEDDCPVIVGAGLAGLTTALSLAPAPVTVLCAGKLGMECSSAWAQGGIAAAVGAGDTPESHAEDTIKAGGGLCDPDIVKMVTEHGAAVVEKLIAHGVPFDRDAKNELLLGLEGAHSRRRVVHVGGDGAGYAILNAIIAAARAAPSITIIENAMASELLTDEDGICGILFIRNGQRHVYPTNRVVLATGGAGALWRHTTNPLGSWGSGLALAAQAGAELIDLEFMQFHPTAIDIGQDPMPLASEALRGEGAILVDEQGTRFMEGFERRELEPRDVVSRAIWEHKAKGHKIFLDARNALGSKFAERFPIINAVCISAGIDPAHKPIPVAPAAHYHMGGVAVDELGRSSVEGLWACGEAAATGLHGANRLASNSLLEAAFFGELVAQDVGGIEMRAARVSQKVGFKLPPMNTFDEEIRDIMTTHAGVVRDEAGLKDAVRELTPLAPKSDKALVALLIATAALNREESRGSHRRSDYPDALPLARRQSISLSDVAYALRPRKRMIGAA